MKTLAKMTTRGRSRTSTLTPRKVKLPVNAAATIRQIGNEWAHHWNQRELEKLVAVYAPDAVYLPPHHPAVHGRAAIHDYLQRPLGHGITDVAFDVTYIKQSGNIAWDVGTYRMTIPLSDGTSREDHGKYLTVWKRVGTKWLITADAWSSDLPWPGEPHSTVGLA